jgi:hypothetical protein
MLINATRDTTSGPGSRPGTGPARSVRSAQPLMLRWLVGRRRVFGVALAAAGWAAIFAAAMVGRGHLGRAAAAQIVFAAVMIIFAMGEALFAPACPVIIDDRAAPDTAGRYKRLGTSAAVTCCLLGLPVGGAALGAGWDVSLITIVAVACAVASIAIHRLGRQPASGGDAQRSR